MPRQDNVPLPPAFSQLASARLLGAPIRAMQGGSRLQSVRGKVLVIGVFENGSVVGFSDDPQPFHFQYDEVDRFTQFAIRKYVNGSYRGTDITCWFALSDSRTYKVGGQSTTAERHIVDDFRELVDPRIATAQLPKMQASLRHGQNVHFGDFVMEPTGLYMAARLLRKERRLAWADIKEVTAKSGSVVVIARDRRGWWASVPAHRLPNLTAFLTLVHAATSG